MSFLMLNPTVSLFCLNLALASVVLGLVTVLVGRCLRGATLPTRHSLYCVALVLMLVSPPLVWAAVQSGVGVVTVSLDSSESKLTIEDEVAVVHSVRDPQRETPADLFVEPIPAREVSPVVQRSDVETVPPAVQETVSLPEVSQAAAEPAEINNPIAGRETLALLGGLLIWGWAVVGCWYLFKLVWGLLLVRRLRASLRPMTDPHILRALEQLNSGNEQHKAMVFESALVPAPLTLGVWRSAIVMPTGLTELLHESELACVLAHEVAHVKRHDTRIALLQQCAVILFWWNPLLRYMNGQIVQLRERICDDCAVDRLGMGRSLAEGIVKVAEWSLSRGTAVPLTTTLLDGAGDMEQRITRLMQDDRRFSIQLNFKSAALVAVVALFLAAIPLLPVVRAQAVAAEQPVPQSSGAGQQVAADTTLSEAKAEPEQEWRVRVRMVNALGNPIENAKVRVSLGNENETNWKPANNSGIVDVTVPSRTPRYCTLYARAPGYAPMWAHWGVNQDQTADPLPSDITFKMTNAITVGGTVIDQEGQPVKNASVLLGVSGKYSDLSQRVRTGFYEEIFTTNERGEWRCDFAPETISSATINVTHPEYVSLPTKFDQSDALESLRDLTHSWTLKYGFALTGRVLNEQGEPVAGAKLALGELNTSNQEGPFAETDAEGRYRFEHVAPAHELPGNQDPIRFTVMVLKQGYAPVMEAVPGYGGRALGNSTAEKRIADFTLKRGVKLALHVEDSKGQPVEGAWVMVNNWHDTTTLRVLQKYALATKTDAEGNWTWENAPAEETISYDVGKSGFADVRNLKITVNQSEQQQTVTLQRPQFITGTVIDAETRKPISEFIVERAFEKIAGHANGLYWTSDLTRGKNGTYRKRVTMPPHNGHYTYRARAEGYKTSIIPSIAFQEGETTLNFELQPEAKAPAPKPSKTTAKPEMKPSLSGRIVDQNQQGISGAQVVLAAYPTRPDQFVDQGKIFASVSTDDAGNYAFKIPAEEITKHQFFYLWTKAPGFGLSRRGWYTVKPRIAEKKPLEISLTKTEGVWVDVVDSSGKPASGVRVIPNKIAFSNGVGYPILNQWQAELTGVTDDAGRTHLPSVIPESLDEFHLIPPGHQGVLRYDQNYFLNYRPAKTRPQYKLTLPEMGAIKGKIEVASGFTLPQLSDITLQSNARTPPGFSDSVRVPVDNNGAFEVKQLAVGQAFVPSFLAEDQPLRAEIPAVVKVEENQETALTIRVAPGVKVYGRVQKWDTKENVKDFNMILIYGQTVSNRSGMFPWLKFDVTTNAEGRFECLVPPGPINLRMNSYADGYTAVDSWLPRAQRGVLGQKFEIPNQESYDLGTIELVKNLPIEGKLVDLDNQPLTEWRVYGFPKVPGFTLSETMNSMAGVRTDKKGIFKGTYPQTYPPAYWRVSHRVWKNEFEFKDFRYAAKVISHDPFILQVDTSKEWKDGDPLPYDPEPL